MLNIGKVNIPVCHGVTRRSFLQIGSAGMAGMMLPNLLRLEANGSVGDRPSNIRNCITIFLVGSPGQLDTTDEVNRDLHSLLARCIQEAVLNILRRLLGVLPFLRSW